MSSKEILTLQFGHYANFVGTHWWNIQESGFEYNTTELSDIDHGVLFREGLTHQGHITFTPRLLLVDLKDSLKTLPKEGGLYEQSFNCSQLAAKWDEDKIELQEKRKVPKNEFQKDLDDPKAVAEVNKKNYKLEETVTVWSDFLYSRFHPRTVNLVNEFQHLNEEIPFNCYSSGVDLWKSDTFEEEFSDKIRNYIEECDHFQGFHILTDCTDGFAGLSSSCLEYLKDEYNTKSVLVLPVIPSFFPDNNFQTSLEQVHSIMNDSRRVLNLLLSFNQYRQFSNMFVPLCTSQDGWRQPGIPQEFYHTQYDVYPNVFRDYKYTGGKEKLRVFLLFFEERYLWNLEAKGVLGRVKTHILISALIRPLLGGNPLYSQHKLPYHSSAILASALDTITLKYRLKSNSFSIMDLCADLTAHSRTAAAASICLPFSLNSDAELIDCLDQWEGPLYKSITPRCTIGTERVMQHITLRGISEARLKKSENIAGKQKEMAAYKCKTVKEMMEFYLSSTTYATASNVTTLQKALPVKNPFPDIFDKFIGIDGNVHDNLRLENTRVDSVPILAGFHSSSEVGGMLQSLHDEAKKIKVARFHQFNIETDEYEHYLNDILTFREEYEDSYLV